MAAEWIVPVIELADAESADAVGLITELDAELAALYPDAPIHLPTPAELRGPGVALVIARVAGRAVACGAVRGLQAGSFDTGRLEGASNGAAAGGAAEVKRMYVRPGFRRRGIGRVILDALEHEARRRGAAAVRIETGDRQPDAVALYRTAGYTPIAPFGEYIGNPVSRCFEKRLVTPARNL